MHRLNQLLRHSKRLERLLECGLAILNGLLGVVAASGGGWRYAASFAVLAITLWLPNQAWKAMTLGRTLRYLILTLAVFSLSA